MSGRKKNRKHRHGQPPGELLSELNSLRDLLGSDMEADIPLLDQVAAPAKEVDGKPESPHGNQPAPVSPRPLQEADLPILFSPVDEEPVEEYTPLLSETDRELLRPLQNLPRHEPPAESADQPEAAELSDQKPAPPSQESAKEEFQPGLFDAPRKPAPAPQKAEPVADSKPAADTRSETATQQTATRQPTARPAASAHKPLPAALTENPFLPPHIRARLTGGRVPRAEAESSGTAPEESIAKPAAPAAPKAPASDDAAADTSPGEDTAPVPSARERLIEQLMAEQLPELERQLRANITLMVNEIYPEDTKSD
ncbi:hypothetical protein JF535_08510 [Microbulbifer salipaludis]|uniref:Uncharacterized protein n=1 Tax=Microbulbifer salipaludis TaxID=187980 RepID=A0ABS3E6G8_9GAMM|nr:hypothetical protein [Microbulbifer salipaludis]MBN8430894.1 hypothetical protein [Microbulbifer salipaludis]